MSRYVADTTITVNSVGLLPVQAEEVNDSVNAVKANWGEQSTEQPVCDMNGALKCATIVAEKYTAAAWHQRLKGKSARNKPELAGIDPAGGVVPQRNGGKTLNESHAFEGRIVALKFPSRDEAKRAVEIFWNDPVLAQTPRDFVGGWKLLVPEGVISYLSGSGLEFEVTDNLKSEPIGIDLAAVLKKEADLKRAGRK